MRTPAMSIGRRGVEVRNLGSHLGEARKLVGRHVVAGDLGLVAGAADDGELLGDGERVAHRVPPTHAAGAGETGPAGRSIRADFVAKPRQPPCGFSA